MSDDQLPAELLHEAAAAFAHRGRIRDAADGTRSMTHTVEIFNAITGNKLTEQEGWYFMVAVKIARAVACPSDRDSFVDAAAFMALSGECALSPPRRPNVPTAAREDE